MTTTLYRTAATSTGEGRAGGRATTEDGLLDDSSVTAEVWLTKTEAGLGLNAALRIQVDAESTQQAAEALVAAAHEVCPYSVATRGNVPVTLTTTLTTTSAA